MVLLILVSLVNGREGKIHPAGAFLTLALLTGVRGKPNVVLICVSPIFKMLNTFKDSSWQFSPLLLRTLLTSVAIF